jgi:hypothetical protein
MLIPEGEAEVTLYHRDERTGDHLVTHSGHERRYATRSEALSAVRDLRDDPSAEPSDGDPAS